MNPIKTEFQKNIYIDYCKTRLKKIFNFKITSSFQFYLKFMLSKQLVLISKLTFKLWLWDLIMILDLSLKITVRLKFVFFEDISKLSDTKNS